MKTYKAILLTVLGLVIVVGGSYMYMRGHKKVAKADTVKTGVTTLEGQVMRMNAGENKIIYTVDIPSTATSTRSMDDALVTVKDNGSLYMAMYMSYEGSRGYASLDYINQNIRSRVHGLIIVGTTTINGTVWTMAQTANSEWHVGQVGDGQWIMVVENKRSSHDAVVNSLQSLTTK